MRNLCEYPEMKGYRHLGKRCLRDGAEKSRSKNLFRENFQQSRPFKKRHELAEYRQHGLNPKHEMPVTARRGKYRVSLQNGGLAKRYRSLKGCPSFRPTAWKALAGADTEGAPGSVILFQEAIFQMDVDGVNASLPERS